jgi:hypothetical protein
MQLLEGATISKKVMKIGTNINKISKWRCDSKKKKKKKNNT